MKAEVKVGDYLAGGVVLKGKGMATITQPNIAREKWIYALTSVISYPEFAALAVHRPNPVEGNSEWSPVI